MRRTQRSLGYDVDDEDLVDHTIQEMIALSKRRELQAKERFPKKQFLVRKIIKKVTAVTDFFQSKTRFPENFKRKIKFRCKLKPHSCKDSVFHLPLGYLTNLNKHVHSHPVFNNLNIGEWYDSYRKEFGFKDKVKLDKDVLKLVFLFLSSNSSLAFIQNPPKSEIASKATFSIKFKGVFFEHLDAK
jgi:hypothetical protein